MHEFIEVPPSEIKDVPNFSHKDNRYFSIVKNGVRIGYISIRPFMDGCNFGVHMMNKYRLNKSIVLNAFKIPILLGFKRIFFITSNKIVSSFLDYMKNFGISYVSTILRNRYYIKNLEA